MTNKEWIDFLVKEWNISRTSAKEMLHAMMSVKKEDNFKRQFNPVRTEENDEQNSLLATVKAWDNYIDKHGEIY